MCACVRACVRAYVLGRVGNWVGNWVFASTALVNCLGGHVSDKLQ